MAEQKDGKKAEAQHFGFGDSPEVEESSYKLLPEGEACFSIRRVSRARRNFGTYGECNIAEIECAVTMVEGGEKGDVKEGIPLLTTFGWKIMQLATAVGLRKHGDGNKINPAWWAKFQGSDGRCVISHRLDKKGRTWNQVEKFLAPEEKYSPKKEGELEI